MLFLDPNFQKVLRFVVIVAYGATCFTLGVLFF